MRRPTLPGSEAATGWQARHQQRLARCLFCKERIDRPRKVRVPVFSLEGCKGGTCERCGAAYVLDETGKNGGDSLLDALAVACGGDLSRASGMQSSEFQVRDGIYYRDQAAPRFDRPYVTPKLWFVRLGPPLPDAPAPPRRSRHPR